VRPCGSATQHQLMRSNLKYTKISRIFITHMHGDHIFGMVALDPRFLSGDDTI